MNPDVREEICMLGGEDALMFDNPDFDNAVIGVTTDGKVVYDYDKMVMDMAERDEVSLLDAAEFIDYNAIRSIPYAGGQAPIVMYPITPEVSNE